MSTLRVLSYLLFLTNICFLTPQTCLGSSKSQNEVLLEYGDITRSRLTAYYCRELYIYEGTVDFRILGTAGLSIIPLGDTPIIPFGVFFRTRNGETKGLSLELGILTTLGDKLEEKYEGYNDVKANYIDFPITGSLIFETSQFLYKVSFGWVLNTAKGEELVAGVSFGVRF